MDRLPLPLGFSFYQSESAPFSAQRCVNWIPTVAEGPALNTRALFQPPGLKQLVDSGLGANRGSVRVDGVPYFINGNTLCSMSSTYVITTHGTIAGTGNVSIAVNSKNVDTGSHYIVIVVPGGNAYAFATNPGTLTQITDVDFRTSDTVVFKNALFLFSSSDGAVFFNSAINDPLNYDALEFGAAEISNDKIVALHVNHDELFVIGEETCELFQYIAGVGFPYASIPGANIQKGAHARFSPIEFDNTFLFAGGGLNEQTAFWKVTGSSSAQKISTDAIDTEIQKFNKAEIESLFTETLARHGQFLALFTIESTRIPSRTFVYNATASAYLQSNIWFELQTGPSDNRFRVQSIVRAYGKLLVGDQSTGIIGELDTDTLDYYGEEIYRLSTTSPFSQNGQAVFAGEFEATMQAGMGLTTGQGSDPQMRMSFSDDGGRTISDEFSRSIGKIGEYGHRSIWRQQGRFPVSRMITLVVTDKVRANLIRLAATPQVGSQ
jgi:hypothetical protein